MDSENHEYMVTAEGLGLDDLRVMVSSYQLATIGLYDRDYRQSFPLFSCFVFIHLLQAVPFSFLGLFTSVSSSQVSSH